MASLGNSTKQIIIYMHPSQNVQAGFRKDRGTRDQIAHIYWIIGKAREFQKNIYFSFIDYAKAFDSVKVKVAESCPTP